MKLSKRKIITISALLIFTGFIILFKLSSGETITGYKDEQFKVYECSRPIKAKKGTVPDLFGGRTDALIPADMTEANKYCQVTGVE